MAKNIWVFCEQRDGEVQNVALELLGVARELAEKTGEKVNAILLGHNVTDKAQSLIAHGADGVYVVDDVNLEKFVTEPYAQAVTHIAKKYEPSVILFGATSIGRDLAPRLSARLKTGLTADCTKLEMDEEGNLFMTRPAFGGHLMATIICPRFRPCMSTVRPGVMKKLDAVAGKEGTVEEFRRWFAPLESKISFCGVITDTPVKIKEDTRKTIEFVGDSITEGHGTSDWATKPYHQVLKANVGLAEARNYGKGGTKISRLPVITDNPFDQDFNLRALDMDKDADMVVVFGGTNDYGHATIPLGTFDNKDKL